MNVESCFKRFREVACVVTFLTACGPLSKEVNREVNGVLAPVTKKSEPVSLNLKGMDEDELVRLFSNISVLKDYVERYIVSMNLNEFDAAELRKKFRLVELRLRLLNGNSLGLGGHASVEKSILLLGGTDRNLSDLVKSISAEKALMNGLSDEIKEAVAGASDVNEDTTDTGRQLYSLFINKFKEFKKYKDLKNKLASENEIALFRTQVGFDMLASFDSLETIARYATNVINPSVRDDNYNAEVKRFFTYMSTNVSQEQLGLKMFNILRDLEKVFVNLKQLNNAGALNEDLKRLLHKLRYEQGLDNFMSLLSKLDTESNKALREASRKDVSGRFGILSNNVTDEDYIAGLQFYGLYKTKLKDYDAYDATNISFGSFEFFNTNDGLRMLEEFGSLKEIADFAANNIENANSSDQHKDFYYHFLYEVSKMNLGLQIFDIMDKINISLNNLKDLEEFNIKRDSLNELLNKLKDEKNLDQFKSLLNQLVSESGALLYKVKLLRK